MKLPPIDTPQQFIALHTRAIADFLSRGIDATFPNLARYFAESLKVGDESFGWEPLDNVRPGGVYQATAMLFSILDKDKILKEHRKLMLEMALYQRIATIAEDSNIQATQEQALYAIFQFFGLEIKGTFDETKHSVCLFFDENENTKYFGKKYPLYDPEKSEKAKARNLYYLLSMLQLTRNNLVHHTVNVSQEWMMRRSLFYMYSLVGVVYLLYGLQKVRKSRDGIKPEIPEYCLYSIRMDNLTQNAALKARIENKKGVTYKSVRDDLKPDAEGRCVVESALRPFTTYVIEEPGRTVEFTLDEYACNAIVTLPDADVRSQLAVAFASNILDSHTAGILDGMGKNADDIRRQIEEAVARLEAACAESSSRAAKADAERDTATETVRRQIDEASARASQRVAEALAALDERLMVLSLLRADTRELSEQMQELRRQMVKASDFNKAVDDVRRLLDGRRRQRRQRRRLLAALLAVVLIAGGVWAFGRYAAAGCGWYSWAHACGDPDGTYLLARETEQKAAEMLKDKMISGYYNYEKDTLARATVRRSAELWREAIARYEARYEAGASDSTTIMRLVEMRVTGKGGDFDLLKAQTYLERLPETQRLGISALLSNMALNDSVSHKNDMLADIAGIEADGYLEIYRLMKKGFEGVPEKADEDRLVFFMKQGSDLMRHFASLVMFEYDLSGYGKGYDGEPYGDLEDAFKVMHFGMEHMDLNSVEALHSFYHNVLYGGRGASQESRNLALLAWDMGGKSTIPSIMESIKNGYTGNQDGLSEAFAEQVREGSYLANRHASIQAWGRDSREDAADYLLRPMKETSLESASKINGNLKSYLFEVLGVAGPDALMDVVTFGNDERDMPAIRNYFMGLYLAQNKDSVEYADRLIKEAADSGVVSARITYGKVLASKAPRRNTRRRIFEGYFTNDHCEIHPRRALETEALPSPDSVWYQAKEYLQVPADLGYPEAYSPLAYVCLQLGDMEGHSKYHKLALENYDLPAVLYDIKGHELFLQSDEENLKDFRRLEVALLRNSQNTSHENLLSAWNLMALLTNIIKAPVATFYHNCYTRIFDAFGLEYKDAISDMASYLLSRSYFHEGPSNTLQEKECFSGFCEGSLTNGLYLQWDKTGIKGWGSQKHKASMYNSIVNDFPEVMQELKDKFGEAIFDDVEGVVPSALRDLPGVQSAADPQMVGEKLRLFYHMEQPPYPAPANIYSF